MEIRVIAATNKSKVQHLVGVLRSQGRSHSSGKHSAEFNKYWLIR